jgi:hypothetical protein
VSQQHLFARVNVSARAAKALLIFVSCFAHAPNLREYVRVCQHFGVPKLVKPRMPQSRLRAEKHGNAEPQKQSKHRNTEAQQSAIPRRKNTEAQPSESVKSDFADPTLNSLPGRWPVGYIDEGPQAPVGYVDEGPQARAQARGHWALPRGGAASGSCTPMLVEATLRPRTAGGDRMRERRRIDAEEEEGEEDKDGDGSLVLSLRALRASTRRPLTAAPRAAGLVRTSAGARRVNRADGEGGGVRGDVEGQRGGEIDRGCRGRNGLGGRASAVARGERGRTRGLREREEGWRSTGSRRQEAVGVAGTRTQDFSNVGGAQNCCKIGAFSTGTSPFSTSSLSFPGAFAYERAAEPTVQAHLRAPTQNTHTEFVKPLAP